MIRVWPIQHSHGKWKCPFVLSSKCSSSSIGGIIICIFLMLLVACCNSMVSMMLRIEMKWWWNVRSVEWRAQKCKFMSCNEKETGSVAFLTFPSATFKCIFHPSLSRRNTTMRLNWHRQIMMETLHINEMIYKWNIIFSLQFRFCIQNTYEEWSFVQSV